MQSCYQNQPLRYSNLIGKTYCMNTFVKNCLSCFQSGMSHYFKIVLIHTQSTCNCLLPIVFNLLPFVVTLIDKNLKFIMGLKPIKNRITVVSIFSRTFRSNQHFKHFANIFLEIYFELWAAPIEGARTCYKLYLSLRNGVYFVPKTSCLEDWLCIISEAR